MCGRYESWVDDDDLVTILELEKRGSAEKYLKQAEVFPGTVQPVFYGSRVKMRAHLSSWGMPAPLPGMGAGGDKTGSERDSETVSLAGAFAGSGGSPKRPGDQRPGGDGGGETAVCGGVPVRPGRSAAVCRRGLGVFRVVRRGEVPDRGRGWGSALSGGDRGGRRGAEPGRGGSLDGAGVLDVLDASCGAGRRRFCGAHPVGGAAHRSRAASRDPDLPGVLRDRADPRPDAPASAPGGMPALALRRRVRKAAPFEEMGAGDGDRESCGGGGVRSEGVRSEELLAASG